MKIPNVIVLDIVCILCLLSGCEKAETDYSLRNSCDDSNGGSDPELLPDFRVISAKSLVLDDCRNKESDVFQLAVEIENIGKVAACSPQNVWLKESMNYDFSTGGTTVYQQLPSKKLNPGESFVAVTKNEHYGTSCHTGFVGRQNDSHPLNHVITTYGKVLLNPDWKEDLVGRVYLARSYQVEPESDLSNNVSDVFEIEKVSKRRCLSSEESLEENDSLEDARRIILGEYYDLSFCTDDVDVVAVELETGRTYIIEKTYSTMVEYNLFDPNGRLLMMDVEHSRIDISVGESGLYRIAYSPFHNFDTPITIRVSEK